MYASDDHFAADVLKQADVGADVPLNGVVLSDLPKHQHVTLSVAKVQRSDEASDALLKMAERGVPDTSDFDRLI